MAKRLLWIAISAALGLEGCAALRQKPKLITPPPPPPAERTPAPPPAPPVIRPPPPPPAKGCVPKTLGPPPRYPDTDAALRNAGGAADRYQLMAAGRILRQQRLDELERVVQGCRTP